jgi:imidazolonepropionase-like amidohydrolase
MPIGPKSLAPVFITASLAVAAAAQQQRSNGIIPQPLLALTHANVVDIRTGTVRTDVTLVLRDGKIAAIGNAPPPAGAQVMDVAGKYLLPGFMDGHYHSRTVDGARRALRSGVTTVRSASVGGYEDVAQREMIKQGYVVGPDVLAAGVYVMPRLDDAILADPRLFKFLHRDVDGAAAVREVVRVNLDHGVDWIKTRAGNTSSAPGTDPREEVYSEAELRAIVEEAATRNVPVECHAHGEVVVMNAVRAGVKTIEHGSYITEKALGLMKEKGTVWNPTFSSLYDIATPHNDYDTIIGQVRAPYMISLMKRMIIKGHRMGIPIITSTDTSYGLDSKTRLYHEITNFVELGMTPLEAIQAATIISAKAYGLEKKTGAIEVGLEADLVAFDRNPLEEIYVTHDPVLVITNGRIGLNRELFRRRPTTSSN